MRVVGLFAGIGGFESGLEAEGHANILLCENDPHAATVLRHRFPRVPLHGDVADLDTLPADADLVTAGFPCQDLSMAGHKAGLYGAKSSIVEHLFRLLADNPVPWVLIENVYFMLHLAGGAAMEGILRPLEELGFHWAYRVVDSRAFGPSATPPEGVHRGHHDGRSARGASRRQCARADYGTTRPR